MVTFRKILNEIQFCHLLGRYIVLSFNAKGYKLSTNKQLYLQLNFKDLFTEVIGAKNCIFIFY